MAVETRLAVSVCLGGGIVIVGSALAWNVNKESVGFALGAGVFAIIWGLILLGTARMLKGGSKVRSAPPASAVGTVFMVGFGVAIAASWQDASAWLFQSLVGLLLAIIGGVWWGRYADEKFRVRA